MDVIISKYFEGETSEAENNALLEWLEGEEKNRQYFFELKSVWNAGKAVGLKPDFAEFAAFMSDTNRRIDKLTAAKRRRRILRWSASAAAAVLLVVGTGTAWHLLSQPGIYRVYENTTDAVSAIMLDDGTQVWLNANTRLTLPDAFDGISRNVQLDGAAFFEVAPDANAPFTVTTGELRIRVLGTAFCVDARAEEQYAEVILERGSVRLQTPEGVNMVTLQPDQRALYDAVESNLQISQVTASTVILHRYDLMTMANATLHEIISHIETTYGVRIAIKGRYDNKRYAFNYQRSQKLEEVLNIIEYMTGERGEVIFRQK